jgi:hypothetical protein
MIIETIIEEKKCYGSGVIFIKKGAVEALAM